MQPWLLLAISSHWCGCWSVTIWEVISSSIAIYQNTKKGKWWLSGSKSQHVLDQSHLPSASSRTLYNSFLPKHFWSCRNELRRLIFLLPTFFFFDISKNIRIYRLKSEMSPSFMLPTAQSSEVAKKDNLITALKSDFLSILTPVGIGLVGSIATSDFTYRWF